VTRVNDRIRARRVRVIDGTNNAQLGVMTPREALAIAKEKGLDLVEIAAKADPPVCKIIDFGKYKYDLKKQRKENPKVRTKLKEIKFRVGIDPHDYGIKMTRAEDFLMDGNKVRVLLQFRGRQMAHKEIGFELVEKVVEDLKLSSHCDLMPKLSGRNITTQLSPLPPEKRARKWRIDDRILPDEIDEEDEEDEEDGFHGDDHEDDDIEDLDDDEELDDDEDFEDEGEEVDEDRA